MFAFLFTLENILVMKGQKKKFSIFNLVSFTFGELRDPLDLVFKHLDKSFYVFLSQFLCGTSRSFSLGIKF